MINGSMHYPTITMLYDIKVGVPMFVVVELSAESMDKGTTDNFSFIVDLGIKGSRISQLVT
jgi:hypothetical protein